MCRLARLLINNMSTIIISAHIQNWHAIFYYMVEVNNMVEKKEFHFQTHNGTFDNPFVHLLSTLIDCEDFIFQIDVVSRLKYIRKKGFRLAEKLML